MKKILAVLLCLCMVFAVVACNKTEDETTDATTQAPTTETEGTTQAPTTNPEEAAYKLGMGVVSSANECKNATAEADGTAQIDATVAAVVLDKDGKIVVCRIDAVQNKVAIKADGTYEIKNLKTKMELGDDYNMSKYADKKTMDWNKDGIIKEWYEQAKAFESFVVGKTAAEVEAMKTQVPEGSTYVISADEALLAAGCTIQITDFKEAVVKACNDEQGTSFKTNSTFTLGVAATSAEDASTAPTEEADGVLKVYSDFAASVVIDGKIAASLNDAIQPDIKFNTKGEITDKVIKQTKRELKENYNMSKYADVTKVDWNKDGVIKEWYIQSAEFSKFVVGKTAAEVEGMKTQVPEGSTYNISADEALLAAGCTIQITGIKAVVAKSVTNAR